MLCPEYDKEAAESEMIQKAMEKFKLTEDKIANTKTEFKECRISPKKQLMLIYKITFSLKNPESVTTGIRTAEMAITIDADCYK